MSPLLGRKRTLGGAEPTLHDKMARVSSLGARLTPPLGLNLFLAAFRFDKPVVTVYRSALRFLLVLVLVVLVVTYVPALIIGVP